MGTAVDQYIINAERNTIDLLAHTRNDLRRLCDCLQMGTASMEASDKSLVLEHVRIVMEQARCMGLLGQTEASELARLYDWLHQRYSVTKQRVEG